MKIDEKFDWVDKVNAALIEHSKHPSEAQKGLMFTTAVADIVEKIWQSGYDACKTELIKGAKKN